MNATEYSSENVASAVGDALRNSALREAELVFGSAQILLTKTQRFTGEPVAQDAPPPEYPVVQTRLPDQADSWLS
jgi:hypothetical protein